MKTKNSIISCVFFVFFSGVTSANPTYPHTIEIFTDSDHPIKKKGYLNLLKVIPKITYYELDGVDKFENKLSKDLPGIEVKAAAIVKKRLGEIGEQWKSDLIIAYRAIVHSYRYKLTHYPAIVFNNGESVIYGITDMSVVMKKYWDYQKK